MMEGDVQRLVLASLSTWLQLIRTPTHALSPNQSLVRNVNSFPNLPTTFRPQLQDSGPQMRDNSLVTA